MATTSSAHFFSPESTQTELPSTSDFLSAVEMKDPLGTTSHENTHDEDEEDNFEYPDDTANAMEEAADDSEEEFTYPAQETEAPSQSQADTDSAGPSLSRTNSSNKTEEKEDIVVSIPEESPSPPTTIETNENEQVLEQVPEQVSEQILEQVPEPVLTPTPSPPAQPPIRVTPAQLESLYTAELGGNLTRLKQTIEEVTSSGEIGTFELVNDASPRTGLTVVHAAASRGHLDVLKYLVEECGSIPDLEDREGETALHKASLNGHLDVIIYLISVGAEVNTRDGDGWTALHNASSKGYLDIVRWLCETGGANKEENNIRGVNARSKGGWTPLMNASSKGHLPVVLYLLSKQSADPLIRNDWGETAYDVAAAVFEIWICEVLQRAEAEKWRFTTVPYDPLSVHTTVPIIIYEHQKLDTRLKTLAVNGGRPKFSVSGLGRKGRRAPFELRLPKPDEETGLRELPAWRSDIQLPLVEDPFSLPKPVSAKDRSNREGAERSHFWLSDWTLDLTHPRVDAVEGWQYAHTFSDSEDQWSAEVPAPLDRLLTGAGIMAAGLGGSGSRSSSASRASIGQSWVRRRRWVRVMRRRLDIPPLPFMGPDGAMYQVSNDGTLVPHISTSSQDDQGDGDGHELGSMPRSFLSLTQDYVARSRYLAGTPAPDTPINNTETSAVEVRRVIAKLERAVMELRIGMLGDEDAERKIQAEVLLNAYSRELERRRLAASAAGIMITNEADDNEDNNINDNDDSDDESFHYPGSSPTNSSGIPRPHSRSSVRSQSTDYFNRSTTSSRTATDLTPHLAQAPEFRVPTHEAPQKVALPRRSTPTPHSIHAEWERDDAASECRECRRRFTFYFRKHCRRCGRIFCDRCSSYRAILDPADVVRDPAFPDSSPSYTTPQRVCVTCYEETNANSSIPTRFQGPSSGSLQRIVVDSDRLSVPNAPRRSESISSQISDLADCPVCGKNLSELGTAAQQEAHVKNCLEGGTGAIQHPSRYLVYRLPEESRLVGTECVICLEEFVKGSMVARLSCLCSFHSVCLSAWLQRGRSCPVHARDS